MKNKEKNKITTIKLCKETKSRLEKLRIHKRETYDEIVQGILNILNLTRINPEMAQKKLISIEKQRKINGEK
ncbi:hypothetical protein HYV50_04730 [Candidatus Pacearchaeota archaeon]|nr:hypothetical protein [Candidatus Pacearchaeota archaeon]